MTRLPAILTILVVTSTASAAASLRLENDLLALRFEAASGALRAVENKLTGETYAVGGDQFAVETVESEVDFSPLTPAALKPGGDALEASYQSEIATVEVTWTLHAGQNFAEKRMVFSARRDYELKKVTVSRPTFAADGLKIASYRYPQFGRAPGTEPICTYFGRTALGGFFTGLELPFDASSLSGCEVVLAYAPSLKVKAGEKLACEPIYVGVYRRRPADDQPSSAHSPIRSAHGMTQPEDTEVVPLPSEADAMVAMTSAILGPPRHGLVPMACGWHSEMQHGPYESDKMVEEEMRSLDFLAECGVDWLSESHPWGGETAKMNALGADDKYAPGELATKFLEHARQKDVKIVMWSSMNNTHHWSSEGRPFRADKPEWLMTPKTLDGKPDLIQQAQANCFANTPLFNWLSRINSDGLGTGYYKGWCMDGSFFGDGGWFTTIIPVDCASNEHDHLPGDSNYACQRALDQLIAGVRQQSPDIFIFLCRPPMDLGVWSLRNADACFTLLETGTPPSNVSAGDEIRTWSRVRVQHHFFPHYLDQPLLFQSHYVDDKSPVNWPREKLDYILLSALSSSPNQLYYLPTKTGIPHRDKAIIRQWLNWGRENIAYLQVRRDLPNWPAPGNVDGSAHIVGDHGLLFLFNPSDRTLPGEFALTEDSIGLQGAGSFQLTQEYPESGRVLTVHGGESVRWEVPAQTAAILRLQKVQAN